VTVYSCDGSYRIEAQKTPFRYGLYINSQFIIYNETLSIYDDWYMFYRPNDEESFATKIERKRGVHVRHIESYMH